MGRNGGRWPVGRRGRQREPSAPAEVHGGLVGVANGWGGHRDFDAAN